MKRVLVILMAAMLLAAGCARKDDKDIYVPSDTERLVLQSTEAEQTEAPDMQIPIEQYTCELSGADGDLSVKVDAKVTAPSVSYPVAAVTGSVFSQTNATGVFETLMAGKDATVTIGKNVQTKAEIADQIQKLKQELEDGSYTSYGFTREEWEQTIAVLEGYYTVAPEVSKDQKLPADGLLRRMGEGENQYEQMKAFVLGGETLTMNSMENPDGLPSSCYYHSERDADRPYTMMDAIPYTAGDGLPDVAERKLTISYGEAKALCDAVLSAAEVDAIPFSVYVVGDRKSGNVDGEVAPAKHYAYQFFYARQYAGIPIATTVWEESSNWDYERIVFVVDDEGIVRMEWFNPITVGEQMRENVALLPFQEIAEVFEATLSITYEPQIKYAYQNEKVKKKTISICVDAVQLCLLRVTDVTKAPARAGILTPAWVFYGSIINETTWQDGQIDRGYQGASGVNGRGFFSGPTMVFAVNAIDGSVIDVAQGY